MYGKYGFYLNYVPAWASRDFFGRNVVIIPVDQRGTGEFNVHLTHEIFNDSKEIRRPLLGAYDIVFLNDLFSVVIVDRENHGFKVLTRKPEIDAEESKELYDILVGLADEGVISLKSIKKSKYY